MLAKILASQIINRYGEPIKIIGFIVLYLIIMSLLTYADRRKKTR